MDAHALGRVMIDSDKHRDLALAGDGRGQVGAPHRVHRVGDDRAVVVAWASRRADPRGRKQVVRAHEPQDAPLGRANACDAQPGPRPYGAPRRGTGWRSERPGSPRPARHRASAQPGPDAAAVGPRGKMAIDGGARCAPDPADTGKAVGLVGHGRDGPAHGLGLRRPKGRSLSRAATFSASSSRSSITSPSLALSRPGSIGSPSVGWVARLPRRRSGRSRASPRAWPPSRPRRATLGRDPHPATAAAPLAACAAATSARRGPNPRRPKLLSASSSPPSCGSRPPTGCLSEPRSAPWRMYRGSGRRPLRRRTPRPISSWVTLRPRSCRASSTICRSASAGSLPASPPRPPGARAL